MNKKLIIRIILFNILTLSSHYSFAQIFDNEQAHPADKWRSITTANYRLLFPQEFEPAAQNLAKELETFIESSSKDLGVIPKKNHPCTTRKSPKSKRICTTRTT